ncbi:MAG: TlyA family RNA methyltransferase [Clostridia bacterium]|nr:TlyA family RNA methyltransferase [Clostridia bacterium]
MRLDVYLTENNLTESRTRAQNLIKLGFVQINGVTAEKASYDVREGDDVAVKKDYAASLGGIKLQKALDQGDITANGKKCLDIGASNGGFCDVLLNNGAERVIALDVGECALPERLRTDSRIIVMDKTNARFVTPGDLPYAPDFITVDVSFISLTQILPVVFACLAPNGDAVCLIKPQFECGKQSLSKKGIVLNKKTEQKTVEKIKDFCMTLGFSVRNLFPAPHPFENKNQEYLIILHKNIA